MVRAFTSESLSARLWNGYQESLLTTLSYTVVAAIKTQVRCSSDRKQIGLYMLRHPSPEFPSHWSCVWIQKEMLINVHGSHPGVTPSRASCFSPLVLECVWCICLLCENHEPGPAWLQIRGPQTWSLGILLADICVWLAQELKTRIWIFLWDVYILMPNKSCLHCLSQAHSFAFQIWVLGWVYNPFTERQSTGSEDAWEASEDVESLSGFRQAIQNWVWQGPHQPH